MPRKGAHKIFCAEEEPIDMDNSTIFGPCWRGNKAQLCNGRHFLLPKISSLFKKLVRAVATLDTTNAVGQTRYDSEVRGHRHTVGFKN